MASKSMSQDSLRDVRHCPNCGEPLIKLPVLQCTRCDKQHALRAFAYRRAGHFIAECIDLDLLAQGETAEEAIGKLQEAMFSYLDVAFADGESTKGLVLRKSPLSHRLRYHFHRLGCFLPRHTSRTQHFVLPRELEGHSLSHC